MTRADHFGFFGPFMRAFGAADAELRKQLYTEALEYEAHLIEPAAYVYDVATQLGLPVPVTA